MATNPTRHAHRRLFCSAAQLAIAASTAIAAFGGAAANAQDGDDQALGQDVIIVTAQRREQNLRDVPIAIDAVSGRQVQFEGIEDVQRLAEDLPSLVVGGQSNTFGSLNLSIRGVGSQLGDPAVGFYIDEVFQANASSFVTQFLDVERVEVLKGPQGTLWGRNTTGGAVHYITKKPDLDGFGAEAYAEAGWYDGLKFDDFPIRKFGGAVNVPLSDQLAVRVSAAKVKEDNYTVNLELPDREPNQDATTVRADLLFKPMDDLSFLFGFSFVDDPFHNAFTVKSRPFPGSGGAFIVDLLDDVSLEDNTFQVRSNASPTADFRQTGYRFEADWTVNDNWSLRSISSYQSLTHDRNTDLDGVPVTLVHNASQQDHEWWSQETQVLFENDRFNFVGGVYYFGENQTQNAQTSAQNSLYLVSSCNNSNSSLSAIAPLCPLINGVPGVFAGILDTAALLSGGSLSSTDFEPGGAWDQAVTIFDGGSGALAALLSSDDAVPITLTTRDFKTNSIALYGQGSLKLSDVLTATAGLRWTRDSKDIVSTTTVSGVLSGMPMLNDSFSAFTPKFALEWRPTDDMLAYASVTRGFKSGTLNLFADGVVAGEDTRVNDETIWAYELGFKGGFADDRILFDGALFYYDYADYQLQVEFPEGPRIFNLPDVAIKGAEAAVKLRPVEPITLGASAAYVDSEVKSDVMAINPFDLAAGEQNLRGATLPRVPDLKLTAFVDYVVDLGAAGSLTAEGSVNYSDAFFNDIFGTFPGGDYTTINANIRYASDDGHWWINVYGRNLTNEEYLTASVFTDAIGEVQFFAPPRTIGVQAGVKF